MMMISSLGERMQEPPYQSEHEMRRYEPPESRYEPHRYEEEEEHEPHSRRQRMEREMRRYRAERGEYDRPQSRMYTESEHPMGFRSHRKHHHDEGDEELSGSFRYRETEGHVQKEQTEPLNEMQVKRWLKEMQNEDGTSGAHFGKDSAEALRRAHCPSCDELEFYAALNMIYSDYCKVAKQMGVDRPEFYAFMAKAFLDDKDAEDDKLLKYMHYIAKQ